MKMVRAAAVDEFTIITVIMFAQKVLKLLQCYFQNIYI